MLMGMSVGICRICGERKPLTFEHIPPRAAGNDHTVKVYTAYREHGDGGLNADAITRSMFGDGDLEDLKYRQSQRGLGVETICRDCNSYLGVNYVQPFVGLFDDVRRSATNVLAEIGGRKGQAVGLDLRGFPPLAFFKQVVSNFCATADGMLDCKDFLLDRENTDFPERYRLHMFIVPDLGAYKLMTGWMAYLFKGGGACWLACVEYPPFGFVLYDRCRSSSLPDRAGDITELSRCPWGYRPEGMALCLPVVDAGDRQPYLWGRYPDAA